jgi:hypothetical protein
MALPTPNGSIPINSPEGIEIFFKSSTLSDDFHYLMPHMVSEEAPTYTGVATSVMLLNSFPRKNKPFQMIHHQTLDILIK